MIHPKAHVDDSVIIGRGSMVWQFASLTRGTVIGEDCTISPHCMLDGVVIGDRCHLQGNVQAGPGFQIGNDVFVGPSVVFANDLYPSCDPDGFDLKALQANDRFAVIVEDWVSIGAMAVILPGVRLGDGCLVASHAAVTKDVPAGMIWTRDGRIIDKPNDWRERRMRWAT